MTLPTTLCDFFDQAQLQALFFHIGRRVAPCSTTHFRQFEQQQIAWEAPLRGEARVAIVLLGEGQEAESAVVWCISLPLDELGLLKAEPRDALLRRMLEQLGTRPSGEALHDPLKDNPLAFRPDPFALAALHAYAYDVLGLPSSALLPSAQAFYSGNSTCEWSSLDYQSVADLCLNMSQQTAARIAQHIKTFPAEPLIALCRMLEHFPTESNELLEALSVRADADPAQKITCLRALFSAQGEVVTHTFDTVLKGSPSREELAIISARGWHLLEHEQRLQAYLAALANEPSFDFVSCIRDLAQIPRLRLLVIMALKNAPDTSMVKRRLDDALQR